MKKQNIYKNNILFKKHVYQTVIHSIKEHCHLLKECRENCRFLLECSRAENNEPIYTVGRAERLFKHENSFKKSRWV